MGHEGKISSVRDNSRSQRLDRNVPRGFGSKSVSLSDWKCSGESACRSLRR